MRARMIAWRAAAAAPWVLTAELAQPDSHAAPDTPTAARKPRRSRFSPTSGVCHRGRRLTSGRWRLRAPPAVVLGCGALENRRRRARGIDLTRDNPVEQLPYRRIFADRCFELAPHPEGGDPEHLVHQVAASALGQRALLLDVRAVLGELV